MCGDAGHLEVLLPFFFFLDTLGWEPGNSRRFLLSWTTSAWKRAPCRVHKHIVVSPIWRRGQHEHAHHSSAIFSCAFILPPPHISTRNYSSVIHPSNPPHIKQDPLVTDHHRSASQSSRVSVVGHASTITQLGSMSSLTHSICTAFTNSAPHPLSFRKACYFNVLRGMNFFGVEQCFARA